MMAKTHIAFSTLLTLTPIAILQQTQTYTLDNQYHLPIIIGGVTLGALIPDIDEKNSTISRMSIVTLLFSWYLKYLGTQHRGATHKFIFFVLFLTMAIASYFMANKEIFIFISAIAFGVLTHQIGDMMVGGGINKGGIYNYFSPFYTNNKTTKFLPFFMRCQINGIKEYFYFLIFTVANIYMLYALAPIEIDTSSKQIIKSLTGI